MNVLGIDTSNYTTSVAVYDTDAQTISQEKKLLPVKTGEKGLRQSDAVFHHTIQLPEQVEKLFSRTNAQISAVGASAFPRRIKGSYMPCFLVGVGLAKSISSAFSLPNYLFSHQEGHIVAALYSANQLNLLNQSFLAFHLSGGTTDALLVQPDDEHILSVKLLHRSLDLKAGQLIDRVGVLLGLPFPCGPMIQDLALHSKKQFKVKATIRNGDCCLSGIENQCQKLYSNGEKPEDIAWYCLSNIISAVDAMTTVLLKEYQGLPLLFSGGVSSNIQMQQYFKQKYKNVYFAEPMFSADNAAGIAILTGLMQERIS